MVRNEEKRKGRNVNKETLTYTWKFKTCEVSWAPELGYGWESWEERQNAGAIPLEEPGRWGGTSKGGRTVRRWAGNQDQEATKTPKEGSVSYEVGSNFIKFFQTDE